MTMEGDSKRTLTDILSVGASEPASFGSPNNLICTTYLSDVLKIDKNVAQVPHNLRLRIDDIRWGKVQTVPLEVSRGAGEHSQLRICFLYTTPVQSRVFAPIRRRQERW